MDNLTFVMDLKEEVGKLSDIQSLNLRFKQYEFQEINGEKILIGKENYSYQDLKFEGMDLLFSLINLFKGKELPERFDVPYSHINQLDSVLTDKEILEWVKKYGFPYIDKEVKPNYLRVDLFRRKIARLYARFCIWRELFEDNSKDIKKYIMALLNVPPAQWENVDLVKKELAQEVGIEAQINMRLRYDKETDKNIFVLTTNSLFSIAYFQFSSLMTKPYEESKKHLKLCKMNTVGRCNNLFWAEHGNEGFCSNPKCNKKTYWYHNNKKKKPTDQ